MTSLPHLLSLPEFALRITARPVAGSLFVLVCPADLIDKASGRLELELEGELQTERIDGAEDAPTLIESFQQRDDRHTVIVSGLESFLESDWRRIDLLRSRLLRDGAIVFVISPAAVEQLTRNAPNLASWIGGSMWSLDIGSELLTPEERGRRLEALREWSQRTDTEILRLAEAGSLPEEPEYVEWLILLKRPDLIGNA